MSRPLAVPYFIWPVTAFITLPGFWLPPALGFAALLATISPGSARRPAVSLAALVLLSFILLYMVKKFISPKLFSPAPLPLLPSPPSPGPPVLYLAQMKLAVVVVGHLSLLWHLVGW
jgi:hypothetical protein